MSTLLTQNDHVRQGNTCGEGMFRVVSQAFHPKGVVPQLSLILILGFLSIYVYTFDVELPNSAW